jgi:hypothetical protein
MTAYDALEVAWKVQLKPVRIAPTADGSIMLTFGLPQGFATLDCLESGTVFSTIPTVNGDYETREAPDTSELEGILVALRGQIQARPAAEDVSTWQIA